MHQITTENKVVFTNINAENQFNQNELTMSSREIAELVNARHDSVKRTIERLIEKELIQNTPLVECEFINGLGLVQKTTEYRLIKRDSYIVVAQLSPEFTAKLVDRWQQLESQNQFNIPQTLPDALRLAANLAEKNQFLENKIKENAPKIKLIDLISDSKESILIGNFAKTIGIGQNKLFELLRKKKVLIGAGIRKNLPYQSFLNQGYFVVKIALDKNNHPRCTTLITGKGQIWLVKKLRDEGLIQSESDSAKSLISNEITR